MLGYHTHTNTPEPSVYTHNTELNMNTRIHRTFQVHTQSHQNTIQSHTTLIPYKGADLLEPKYIPIRTPDRQIPLRPNRHTPLTTNRDRHTLHLITAHRHFRTQTCTHTSQNLPQAHKLSSEPTWELLLKT